MPLQNVVSLSSNILLSPKNIGSPVIKCFMLLLSIHGHKQTGAVIPRSLHADRTGALVMARRVSTYVLTFMVTFTLVDVYKRLNVYMLNYIKIATL